MFGSAGKSYIGKLQNGQDYKVVFYLDEELMSCAVIKVESGYLKLLEEEMNEGGFFYRDYLKNKGIFAEN